MAHATIWRLPKVLRHTGLSRSTVYQMIGRGDFPQQVKLGRRAVGWIADDVVAWIHARAESQALLDRCDDHVKPVRLTP